MKHMKLAAAALALGFTFSVAPARAQSDAAHVLDAVFYGFDEDHDGVITGAEANRFIDKTFSELDRGKTGKISPQAWMSFSFGLADVAADQGRSDAYDRAKAKIFKRWDRAKSGALTLEDYRAGVLGDARKAVGGATKDADLRIDLAAFKRAPFVRQLMRALH
ncbi:MAG: hypothetical protein CTY15_07900 [Methylocystis sp.]|nr:MAG: hypothetical protein CTY15_07900 [Methylocystis sp.]